MFVLVLIAFVLVPIAELYVIIQVGGAIGVLPTVALLVADSFLGAALLRSQGRAAWARFNEALARNKVPAREVFDGAMIILGGALLLTPGFITDILGLCLLLPPTRAVIRRGLTALAGRRTGLRWVVSGPGARRAAGDAGPTPPPPSRSYDVEGTASEVGEPDELGPGGEHRG
ncbi:MAG: FxsA family protein [Solirubrobacterales bacterium]